MPDATVVIATRNRLEHVRKAVASVASQTISLDVLVMDDASTDGTAAALRAEFPDIRVETDSVPRRQMARRNTAMRIASTEFVICLDDDAFFDSPRSAQQTLEGFDSPEIAAVTIPYINVRRETYLRHAPPTYGGAWAVGVFAAGACAFRRSSFMAVGGYKEELEYQAEEGDLALRFIAAGHVLRAGSADPLVHWEAHPVKPARARYLNARNEVYLTWLAVPRPYLVVRLTVVATHALAIGIHNRHPLAVLQGLAAGLRMSWRRRHVRRPVSRGAYRFVRRLRRGGPVPLSEAIHEAARIAQR